MRLRDSIGIGLPGMGYYLRITVADRPGVLAQISKILGDLQIRISSVIQRVTWCEWRSPMSEPGFGAMRQEW